MKKVSKLLAVAFTAAALFFTTNVKALVAFEADFSFYVKDSIDRDFIRVGSRPHSVEEKIEFQLVITVRRDLDPEPNVVNVEVVKKPFEVDFGDLEPFCSKHTRPSEEDESSFGALMPLHECIFFIVWEARDHLKSQSILGPNNTMLEELILLRSAADYQAKYESVSHQPG